MIHNSTCILSSFPFKDQSGVWGHFPGCIHTQFWGGKKSNPYMHLFFFFSFGGGGYVSLTTTFCLALYRTKICLPTLNTVSPPPPPPPNLYNTWQNQERHSSKLSVLPSFIVHRIYNYIHLWMFANFRWTEFHFQVLIMKHPITGSQVNNNQLVS